MSDACCRGEAQKHSADGHCHLQPIQFNTCHASYHAAGQLKSIKESGTMLIDAVLLLASLLELSPDRLNEII